MRNVARRSSATFALLVALASIAIAGCGGSGGTTTVTQEQGPGSGQGAGGAGKSAPGPGTTTTTTTQTTPPTTPTTTATSGSVSCGGDLSVGPNTSCPFAENVRDEYEKSGGGNVIVRAFSPTTGVTYEMACGSTGDTIVCTGGNDASVFFPGG
jgi:hypothetical protein